MAQNDANQRVDKFLTKTYPNLPQSMLYKAIRKKDIKVNGKRCEISTRLQEGDVLTELKLGDTVYALDRNFDIADALLNARPDMTLTVTFTRGGTQMSGTYTFKTSDFTAVE